MERTIEISVRDRIAWQTNKEEYICGNGDFAVVFAFDEEWADVEPKTARFVHGDQHTDVVFTGNRCNVPKILGVKKMDVGVYAGDLQTTTPATVSCKKSILCGGGMPADPAPDVYAQLMATAVLKNPEEDNAVQIGKDTNAEWRSLATGYKTTANSTSFAAGRLSQATGKGSSAVGVETYETVEETLIAPVSIDANAFDVEGYGSLDVGDFVAISPVSGDKSWVTTDAKQIVGVDYVAENTIRYTIDSPFRHAKNYHEANNAPADGFIPTNAIIKKAIGVQATANGAHAEGYSTMATGSASHAEGYRTEATGNYAHAEGYMTEATGAAAHAQGSQTKANYEASFATGLHLETSKNYQTVVGKYNDVEDSKGKIFVVGCGTKDAPKNGLTVHESGATYVNGNLYAKNGVTLTAPDGSRWRLTVTNSGTLKVTKI